VFFRELGTLWVQEKQLITYLKAKNACILTQAVDEYIQLIG
jgi:hypothetical protein